MTPSFGGLLLGSAVHRDVELVALDACDQRHRVVLPAAVGGTTSAASALVVAARDDRGGEQGEQHGCPSTHDSPPVDLGVPRSLPVCVRRRSWSRYTAAIRTTPTATSCQKGCTPMITNPFSSTAGMKHADDRADHGAAAAEQARAAEDDGGDRLQVVCRVAADRRRGEAGEAMYPASPASSPLDAVDRDQMAVHVDAGAPRASSFDPTAYV